MDPLRRTFSDADADRVEGKDRKFAVGDEVTFERHDGQRFPVTVVECLGRHQGTPLGMLGAVLGISLGAEREMGDYLYLVQVREGPTPPGDAGIRACQRYTVPESMLSREVP